MSTGPLPFIRISWFPAFFLVFLAGLMNGCTVGYGSAEPGLIPEGDPPTAKEEELGHDLFEDVRRQYEVCWTHSRYQQLNRAFRHVTKAARADQVPWHIHVLSDPEVIDLRAVCGNRIFVWSGFLDAVENEDEIAAVLANEIGHVLAHHTEPVQFHPLSDVLFQVASLAANVGAVFLTQGMLAITGNWSKWVYMKAANLNPLDREYSEEEEKEAASTALQILHRSSYAPEALVSFWRRMEKGAPREMSRSLQRDLSPEQRVALLESLLTELEKRQDHEPAKSWERIHTGTWSDSGLHPVIP